MNQTEPKFIGKRIRVMREKDAINIEINQKIERWQEAMLFFWITAWTFCGGAFLYYAFNANSQSEQIFFIICSSLWLFFFIRITKVFLWRLIGKEMIRISKEGVSIRNAFGSWGKKELFVHQNIFKPGLIKRDPTSFLAFLDDSFWIIGGERVGFSYSGRRIQLGKQLTLHDAELLLRVMESAMREYKKG
jgi:hypothetical protein